ncbi:MAG: peptide chain release factor 3 [Vicinamibacteraceae bacterium]|nr:peptide chain release factor 3 [Vicinamibacteraceae bacterium]
MTAPASPDSTRPVHESLAREVSRRRTFAIISHPDAGKTTLTEKTLLYAGAIELAGAVRGRKNQRAAVSDWMDVERERGISITSAALEFEIDGRRLTLLDTPGHKDFSEDTYRTLFAVDSVVMVIDAAKGIEPQTRKLFEVCRSRDLPILTFVNKLDHPARDPLELLDEIERVLGIHAVPMNWPVGTGDRFKGVYDLQQHALLLYDRVQGGQRRAPVHVAGLDDPTLADELGVDAHLELQEVADMLAGAGAPFDLEAYRAARQTPTFFGSALMNFGLEPFLRALVELAPSPAPRPTTTGALVDPASPGFSGFVFKIQANMNPRHRDRIAFLRVCSGELTKDMVATNARLGGTVRLSRPHRFFGRERETVDVAYAGDVVGLVNPGKFTIGDTLYAGTPVEFPPVPRFAAEHFGALRLEGTRHKQFDEGVRQLEEEGLMQVVFPLAGRREPIVGVVGALQFDVIEARMRAEYNVPCRVDRLPYAHARWVDAGADGHDLKLPMTGVFRAVDRQETPVLLFESDWELQYTERQNPGISFLALH